MPCSAKRIRFDGLTFDVCDDVYEPAEDSFLFAQNLNVRRSEVVLDLGTGSGILALIAATQGAQSVLAVDLNPYAVRCAKMNAELNGVDNVDFLQSDLFSALRGGVKFDLVMFNAPYLPSEAVEQVSWIERSWAGGADGRAVIDRFIAQVRAYLKLHGRVLLMQSTLTGVEQTMRAFQACGLKAELVATQKLPFFEILTLIEAKTEA